MGSQVFSKEEVESCVYFLDTAESSLSEGFPSQFLLGNLQNLAFWNLLSLEQDLYQKLPEFSNLEPLSYVPVSRELIESVETRLDSEIDVPMEGMGSGRRNFGWEKFLLLVYAKLFGKQSDLLRVEMKKLFDLQLREEHFHSIPSGMEISLPLDAMPHLATLIQTFFQERQVSFQNGPLKFTKQSLEDFGIHFPKGCFYESSGYGIHCFYLSELNTLFLFHTSSRFPVVWYVFLRMLSEMNFFSSDLDPYLSKLEESLRLYPWAGIESHS